MILLLILAGLFWTVWAESIPVAIVTAALILFRAQRPSKFRQRVREAWYQRQALQVGENDEQ